MINKNVSMSIIIVGALCILFIFNHKTKTDIIKILNNEVQYNQAILNKVAAIFDSDISCNVQSLTYLKNGRYIELTCMESQETKSISLSEDIKSYFDSKHIELVYYSKNEVGCNIDFGLSDYRLNNFYLARNFKKSNNYFVVKRLNKDWSIIMK